MDTTGATPRSIVISSPPGGRLGGHFRSVALALASVGHIVRFLVPAAAEHIALGEGVETIGWPSGSPMTAMRLLAAQLRSWSPDLVIGSFAGDLVLLQAAALAHVPRRAVFHHTPRRQVEIDVGGLTTAHRVRWVRRAAVYRLATDVLCATEHTRRDLLAMRVPPSRITTTPYVIPDPGLGLRHRAPGRIVIVGRLDRSKGHDTLIRALPHLAGASDVHVVVIGEGPLRQELVALAEELGVGERLRWRGHVSNAQVEAELRMASVACFPSRDEGFGLVLLEAFAAATPVVASRIPSFTEVVAARPEAASLVAVDDPPALADGLRRALERPESAGGAVGRLLFEDRYSASTQTERLVRTYQGLLA